MRPCLVICYLVGCAFTDEVVRIYSFRALPSPVEARITGGSTREVYTLSPLVVDGSSSFDPDVFGVNDGKA